MKIKSIKKYQYSGIVHNISCVPDHKFRLSAGVFTHNCGTGEYFVKSLTTEEIVSQPIQLLNDTGVVPQDIQNLQIMFMSMGEPLLNKNVIPAIHQLNKLYPNAALLLSSIGPKVSYEPWLKCAEEVNKVGLQFSVHESTNEKRNELIPFKSKLTLEEIAEVGKQFFLRTGRTPFFNYCVHRDNNTIEDADRLVNLFSPVYWQATISVVCERDENMKVAYDRQRKLADDFRDLLVDREYRTRVFDPHGQDTIGGGCGQLWWVQKWMKENPDKAIPTCGSGRDIRHTELVELK